MYISSKWAQHVLLLPMPCREAHTADTDKDNQPLADNDPICSFQGGKKHSHKVHNRFPARENRSWLELACFHLGGHILAWGCHRGH